MRLVIPSPSLPVPAVKGGAVETGIQQLIDQNEIHNLFEIIIISVYDEQAYEKSKNYKNTTFFFIKQKKMQIFIRKFINKILRTFKINRQIVQYKYFLEEMKQILNKIKFDFILLKNTLSFVIPLKNLYGDKIILQLHNDLLNNNSYNAENILNNSKLVLVNSNYIKDRVLTIDNMAFKKIKINLNCTDLDLFNKEVYTEKVSDIKNKFNIGENDFVIFFSGRIVKEKGVLELVEAVKLLPSKYNFKLIIVGSSWFGKNTKNKYINKLLNSAKEIEHNIIFTGYIPYHKIAELHAISDIAVIPSIWEEPAGRVVIEAEASGLPVVVTDAGGIEDYITSKSALVVKRDNNIIENIRNKIYYLMINKDIRNSMGREGVLFTRKFSPENYYKELYDYLFNIDK